MGFYRCTLEVCHGYLRIILIAYKIIVYKYKPLLSHSDTPSFIIFIDSLDIRTDDYPRELDCKKERDMKHQRSDDLAQLKSEIIKKLILD